MMIQAVRDDLLTIRTALGRPPENLSLLFDRFSPYIDEPDSRESTQKQKVMEHLISYYPSSIASSDTGDMHIYRYAFNRWKEYLQNSRDITYFTLLSVAPMVIGLGGQNVHEFGIALQIPWATPYIPGTAVKGVASAFAHRCGGDEWHKTPCGHSSLALFGGTDENDKSFAGTVDFLPAWWVPDHARPFAKDIITLHNKGYYQQGNVWPDGTDSPLPNAFAVIQPGQSFLFAVKGSEKWRETAATIVKLAAAQQGFGAKSRVGYGRFEKQPLEELANEISDLNNQELAEAYQTRNQLTPLSRAFQKEARTREYREELKDLFLKYCPEKVLWSQLSRMDQPAWKQVRNCYEQLETRLKEMSATMVPEIKTRIYQFCISHAPDTPPGWINNFKPVAGELLAGKDGDGILSFLENWDAPEPTIEDFIDAVNKMNALDQDTKDLIVMELAERQQ
jgi:CRISPR type III-B/RAMP module RAMP protein Cmr6